MINYLRYLWAEYSEFIINKSVFILLDSKEIQVHNWFYERKEWYLKSIAKEFNSIGVTTVETLNEYLTSLPCMQDVKDAYNRTKVLINNL